MADDSMRGAKCSQQPITGGKCKEGQHLQAQVGKDKGLRQERRKLEKSPERDLRVGRDAVIRIVRMKHTREKKRHYA